MGSRLPAHLDRIRNRSKIRIFQFVWNGPVRWCLYRVALNQPVNMNTFAESVGEKYRLLVSWLHYLQSPFLLLLRVYFFWQLFQTGQGKLTNLGKVTEYFASLNIPFPALSAGIVGFFETFGSLLLIVGLASRITAIPIVFLLCMAYLAGDFEAVSKFFSDPDKFVKADPFPFLLTALIILIFGPGKFSLDAVIARLIGQKPASGPAHEKPSGL
jgi:putative oxidoreductase